MAVSAPPTRATNTMAVLSVVFAFVFPPLGAVFGHLARRQIRNNGGGGQGLANAGLLISYLWLAFWAALAIGALIGTGSLEPAPTTATATGLPIWQAVVLGIVEGVTEFLPVSSTGHLTITEKLLGLRVDDVAITAFTAIIQVGAIAAAIIYFWRDIVRIVAAFFRGLFSRDARQTPDWRLSIAVVVGSLPIAVVGLAAKDIIEGPLRSLWVVAAGLIVWSGVMVFAEWAATQRRHEHDVTLKDGLIIGLTQCFALVPGVSRSGATISAGLLRDLDRVTATRLSFLLGIPALTAAGALEAVSARDQISATVGWGPTGVGLVVSFVVAYASIAWLLRFVARHSIVTFVWYRLILGGLVIAALATSWLSAT
jgi:undecaprenyl-diphosphatase